MFKNIMCLAAIVLGGVGAYEGLTHHNLTQTGVYFLCMLVAWLIFEVAQPNAKAKGVNLTIDSGKKL